MLKQHKAGGAGADNHCNYQKPFDQRKAGFQNAVGFVVKVMCFVVLFNDQNSGYAYRVF